MYPSDCLISAAAEIGVPEMAQVEMNNKNGIPTVTCGCLSDKKQCWGHWRHSGWPGFQNLNPPLLGRLHQHTHTHTLLNPLGPGKASNHTYTPTHFAWTKQSQLLCRLFGMWMSYFGLILCCLKSIFFHFQFFLTALFARYLSYVFYLNLSINFVPSHVLTCVDMIIKRLSSVTYHSNDHVSLL